jgi:acyl dehydratase
MRDKRNNNIASLRNSNDRIHVEQVVKEMRENAKKDQGILTFEKEVINQRSEVVQTGTTTVLLAKRSYKRER